MAEVLADFRTLQFYISSAPSEPQNAEETYTEGWETLRQCVLDGHHILECAADMRVPVAEGGDLEQTKAELRQYVFLFLEGTNRWILLLPLMLPLSLPIIFPIICNQIGCCRTN